MKYTKPSIEIQKFELIEDVTVNDRFSIVDPGDDGDLGWEVKPIVQANSVNRFNITQ